MGAHPLLPSAAPPLRPRCCPLTHTHPPTHTRGADPPRAAPAPVPRGAAPPPGGRRVLGPPACTRVPPTSRCGVPLTPPINVVLLYPVGSVSAGGEGGLGPLGGGPYPAPPPHSIDTPCATQTPHRPPPHTRCAPQTTPTHRHPGAPQVPSRVPRSLGPASAAVPTLIPVPHPPFRSGPRTEPGGGGGPRLPCR